MQNEHVVSRTVLAVRELALGVGPLQERLEDACDEILTLQSTEVDERFRDDFVALITLIMQTNQFAALNETAAQEIARRILDFHLRVGLGM